MDVRVCFETHEYMLEGQLDVRMDPSFRPLPHVMQDVAGIVMGTARVELQVAGRAVFSQDRVLGAKKEEVLCHSEKKGMPLSLTLPVSTTRERPRHRLNHFLFDFEAALPQSMVPSFIGAFVSYSYYLYLTITDARGSVLEHYRFPFSYHPAPGKLAAGDGTPFFVPLAVTLNQAETDLRSASKQRYEAGDIARSMAQNKRSGRAVEEPSSPLDQATVYNIKADDGLAVARVLLPASVVQCGSVLHGLIDFEQAELVSLRIEIELKKKEQLLDPLKAKKGGCEWTLISAQHLYVHCSATKPFAVHIPSIKAMPTEHGTPSFTSRHVNVSWLLHFRFVFLDEHVGETLRDAAQQAVRQRLLHPRSKIKSLEWGQDILVGRAAVSTAQEHSFHVQWHGE